MNAPRRPPRRRVDGVLLLDKPAGITSNGALQAARRLLNAEKAGHTGTLDPLASGLLPLCFGEATKFAGELLEADKTYEATVRLGVRTETGDAEGRILETRPVEAGQADVAAALGRFVGEISQVPPMHSALKRDGRPLYEYAREGRTVERAPRLVVIHRLEMLDFAGSEVVIRVECSKGTYIRTLAEDLGAALGCGAHLTALRRTAIAALSLAGTVTLEALGAMTLEARDACLAPVDRFLLGLPPLALDAAAAGRFLNGQPVSAAGLRAGRVRVYAGPRFLGLAESGQDGLAHPRRLVAAGC